MQIRDLISKLQSFNQDATVKVVVNSSGYPTLEEELMEISKSPDQNMVVIQAGEMW